MPEACHVNDPLYDHVGAAHRERNWLVTTRKVAEVITLDFTSGRLLEALKRPTWKLEVRQLSSTALQELLLEVYVAKSEIERMAAPELQSLLSQIEDCQLYQSSQAMGQSHLAQVDTWDQSADLATQDDLDLCFLYGFMDRFVIEPARERLTALRQLSAADEEVVTA
jgi:hypothetical protein